MPRMMVLPVLLLASCSGVEPDRGDTSSIVVPEPRDEGEIPAGENASAAMPDRSLEVAAAPGSARAAAERVRAYLDRLASDPGSAGLDWSSGPTGSVGFAGRLAALDPVSTEVGTPGPVIAMGSARRITVPVRIVRADSEDVPRLARFVLERVDADGAGGSPWTIRSASFGETDDPPPVATWTADGTTRYACADGSTLSAMFDNGTDTVTLVRDGEQLGILDRQVAGSGIAYAGQGLALRGKGDRTTITGLTGDPLDCMAER